jgi:hypothetical protein
MESTNGRRSARNTAKPCEDLYTSCMTEGGLESDVTKSRYLLEKEMVLPPTVV